MSERKNIDDFFKERFQDFESAPPTEAWGNIREKLQQKKKRRVLPFWWKWAGVAAVFVIGFLLFGPGGATVPVVDDPKNPVVNQQTTTNTDKNGENVWNNSAKNGQPVATVEQTPGSTKNNTAADQLDAVLNSSVKGQANGKAANGRSQSGKALSQHNPLHSKPSNTVAQVRETVTEGNQNTLSQTNTESQKQNPAVAQKTTLPKETLTPSALINPNGLAQADTSSKSEGATKKDSTKLAAVEPNTLEELLHEKEKKIAKERKENRWQVTPNIAPIYFSSISNGSPLDEKLSNNEKSFGTSLSYGMNVNYALGKKWQLRSGIQAFSTDYDTRNIVYYQTNTASKMQHVTPTLQGSLIQIDPLTNLDQNFGRLINDKFEGTLNQRMGYIEMPIEVSYRLLAKKFGIDLIGGFSTLLLTQNDVYLKTSGFSMKIGEANNLNDLHFSTNVGIGFKYAFWKRFDARVEPIFKYQVNTYSSGDGNFKPYIFGIYSGISYHF